MSETGWRAAIGLVLRHEGGWSDHPADPGGATRYGVSLRYLRGLGPAGDLNGDGTVDAADVRGLTPEAAAAIYRRDWWDRWGYGRLPDPVAVKVMDLSVNMGPARAHRLLQRAVNAQGGRRIAVDGVLGAETLGAVLGCAPERLVAALRREAADTYRRLIAANPKLEVFRRGWMRRAAA